MEYYSIQKRSKIINIICIIVLGVLLLLLTTSEKSTVSSYVICIILILIAAFAKNNTIVSESCVDNCVFFLGLKLHGRWKWKDVSYMSIDFTRVAPNALVTFKKRRTRGSRTAMFKSDCMQQIVDWAVKNSPDIRIDTKGPHNLKVKKRSIKPGRKLSKKVY